MDYPEFYSKFHYKILNEICKLWSLNVNLYKSYHVKHNQSQILLQVSRMWNEETVHIIGGATTCTVHHRMKMRYRDIITQRMATGRCNRVPITAAETKEYIVMATYKIQ